MAMGFKGRDVEVVAINQEQYLVAACDSCGAVGLKELDLVKVDPCLVGRMTARVVLMEIIAVGGQPQLATIAVASEPEPTGAAILKGVREELTSFELPDLPLAISTEKNFVTRQTGLGLGMVGLCPKTGLRIATTRPGDILYCLGLPKVGPELRNCDDPEIVQGRHLQMLLQMKGIHDLIPVGSKGIAGEAEMLAANTGGRLSLEAATDLDLTKSAGPSTCLLFSAAAAVEEQFFDSLPCHQIGMITAPD